MPEKSAFVRGSRSSEKKHHHTCRSSSSSSGGGSLCEPTAQTFSQSIPPPPPPPPLTSRRPPVWQPPALPAWATPDHVSQYTPAAFEAELSAFVAYARLTPSEIEAREETKSILLDCARSLWPSSTSLIFGSYPLGISLANSDIDVALAPNDDELVGSSAVNYLYSFAEVIEKTTNFSAQVIAEAKVPIIKVMNRTVFPPLLCDVTILPSLEKVESLVRRQQNFLDTHPCAVPLILATKSLLRQWGLNNVFTGGLSSTAIFRLVQRCLGLASPAGHRSPVPESPTAGPCDGAAATPPGAFVPNSGLVPATAAGDMLLKFWWHLCGGEYCFGFHVMDETGEVDISAGTFRVSEIQMLINHALISVYGLFNLPKARQRRSVNILPPTILSVILRDPRCKERSHLKKVEDCGGGVEASRLPEMPIVPVTVGNKKIELLPLHR